MGIISKLYTFTTEPYDGGSALEITEFYLSATSAEVARDGYGYHDGDIVEIDLNRTITEEPVYVPGLRLTNVVLR